MQSILEPHGLRAAETAELAWLLFAGGALVLLLVVVAIALALSRWERARQLLASDASIVAAGAALPIAALSALLAYGLRVEAAIEAPAEPALAIEVSGERWWWRVRYLDERGRWDFATANELHVPIGLPVELRLRSADVIHSFWVPSLAGKVDMIPGRENRLLVQATRAGVLRGQCAEYCGGAHWAMALHVVSEPREAFEAWRARQRQPAREPAGEEMRRGREVFLQSGCGACHRIAGTPARGSVGPDLTHVGGRTHHAAGLLRTHPGTLAGWIASAQRIKPEVRMPSYHTLRGADLRALATWLASLE